MTKAGRPFPLGLGCNPIRPGHPNVHQYDIGLGAGYHRDRLTPVAGLADDLEVIAVSEQRAQATSYQGLIVGQHYPNHVSIAFPRTVLVRIGATEALRSRRSQHLGQD
jgi:hypothetical protein